LGPDPDVGTPYINLSSSVEVICYFSSSSVIGIPVKGTQRLVRNVNSLNGNLCFSVRDFELHGRGPDIKLTRTYNSKSDAIGIFGKGWTTNYDMKILNPKQTTFSIGDSVYLLNQSGAIQAFRCVATGPTFYDAKFKAPSGIYLWLSLENNGNDYVVKDKYRTKYYFINNETSSSSCNGYLKKIKDKNGHELNLSWSSSSGCPALSSITSPSRNNFTINLTNSLYQLARSNEPGIPPTYYKISVINSISFEGRTYCYTYEQKDQNVLYAWPYLSEVWVQETNNAQKYYHSIYNG